MLARWTYSQLLPMGNRKQKSNNNLPEALFKQLNMHHCRDAASLFRRNLDNGHTGISLIQEPYVYDGMIRCLGQCDQIHHPCRTDSKTRPQRACVVTRRDIHAIMLSDFSDRDIVAVEVDYKLNGAPMKVICCSLYLAFDLPVINETLVKLIAYCRQKGLDLLVGCDANAHHTVWGSSDTNPRGALLLEFLFANNLIILNKGNRPTFADRRREEVLDITFCSVSLAAKISNWEVLQEENLSDHRTISFTLLSDPPKIQPFRNPRKTNFPLYLNTLQSKLEEHPPIEIRCVEDIDLETNAVTKCVTLAYEASCRLIVPSNSRPTSWWTDEIDELVKQCNYAWNHRNRLGYDNFSACRNKLKTAKRNAQRIARWKFMDSVVGSSATARLHKLLSKSDYACVSSLRLPDGSYTRDSAEMLDFLMTTHFPNCIDHEVDVPVTPSSRTELTVPSDTELKKILSICDPNKIKWMVNKFLPFKSPGSDGIFPILLQKGFGLLEERLRKIFIACLSNAYIPSPWRTVSVRFIQKPGRMDTENVKSRRAISLSSFLLKTLEGLVDLHVRMTSLVNSPLHSQQHAYQMGKSTSSAALKLVSHIEETLAVKDSALVLFLDIEGAFDRATYDSFRKAAHKLKIDPFVIDWIISMLKNRTLEASLNGVNVRKIPVIGCPQGGVISPLIWLIICNDLLDRLSRAGFLCVGYADDFAIVSRGKFISTVIERMSHAINIVQEFALSVHLSVNPEKVATMVFTRSRVEVTHQLSMFGKPLKLVKEFKYLGLLIDDKLDWKKHMLSRVDKARKVLFQCRNLVGKTFGLSPAVMHWIYSMVIRPIVTYCSLAWWSRTEVVEARTILGRIQRLSLVCITGAFSTTPTAAMETLLNIAPLDIQVQAEAMLELIQLRSRKQLDLGWGRFSNARTLWTRMLKFEPLLEGPSDLCMPELDFNIHFDTLFPSREQWTNIDEVISPLNVNFFTDGSLCEGLAGSGVYSESVSPKLELSFPLGENISVFQAELFAILKFAEYCSDSGVEGRSIRAFVDSRAALLALICAKNNSALVRITRNAVNQLALSNDVSLIWVPGHRNIDGNEMADQLARDGSAGLPVGPSPILPLSYGWVKSTIERWTRNTHFMRWTNSPEYGQSKIVLTSVSSPSFAKSLLKLSKKNLRRVTGFLTGHFLFKKHLNSMHLVSDTLCPRCEQDEDTAFHAICLCPNLAFTRAKILGDYSLSQQELSVVPLKNLVKFILRIKYDPSFLLPSSAHRD